MPVEVSALFEEGTREGVRCTAHDPCPRRRRFLRISSQCLTILLRRS